MLHFKSVFTAAVKGLDVGFECVICMNEYNYCGLPANVYINIVCNVISCIWSDYGGRAFQNI